MDAEEVRAVILNKRKNPRDYDELTRTFEVDFRQGIPDVVSKWLHTVKACISCFSKDTPHLIDTLLAQDLWSLKTPREEFLDVFPALVSSCSLYAEACMAYLLGYLHRPLPAAIEQSEQLEQLRQDVDTAVLSTLHEILNTVPGQMRNFERVMREQAPHFSNDIYVHTKFCFNVYDLALAFPAIAPEVLRLMIRQIIKMDAEWKAARGSDAAEDHQDADQLDVYDGLDDLDDELADGSTSLSRAQSAPAASVDMFQKVDTLMKFTIEFIHTRLYDEINAQPEETFDILMDLFESDVLVTYRPAFVQYIWFYVAHYDDASYAQRFVETCFTKLGDPSCPEIVRQAAAAYVGSFIARADYLSLDFVAKTIMACVEWATNYAEEHGEHSPQIQHHTPFYALCQAIFYMLCFRCDEFSHYDHGISWMRNLSLEQITRSPLNPLKYTSEPVVDEFTKAMKRLSVIHCETEVLRNKGASVASMNAVMDGGVRVELLEDFFPFDPVELPSICETISDLYRKWQPVDGGEMEDMVEPRLEGLAHSVTSSTQGASVSSSANRLRIPKHARHKHAGSVVSMDEVDDFLAQSVSASLTVSDSFSMTKHTLSLLRQDADE